MVLPTRVRPSTAVQPKVQQEDMGARLGVPSSFLVLSRTTGVPKYRIFGCISMNAVSRACMPKPPNGFRLCLEVAGMFHPWMKHACAAAVHWGHEHQVFDCVRGRAAGRTRARGDPRNPKRRPCEKRDLATTIWRGAWRWN